MDVVTYALTDQAINAVVPVYETGYRSPRASDEFANNAAWGVLDNSRVIRVGGNNGATNYYAAFIWDRNAQAWTAVARYPGTTIKGASGARLSDGKCLIIGGSPYSSSRFRNATANVYVYDTATNAYTAKAPMNQGRARHGTAELDDGRVFVWGGGSEDDTPTFATTSEVYDPISNIWTTKASLSHTYGGWCFATNLGGGKILVHTGGVNPNLYLYDVSSNTFTSLGPTADADENLAVVAMTRPGVALIMFNYSSSVRTGQYEYDVQKNKWTLAAWRNDPITFPSPTHKLVRFPDGYLLYCGSREVTEIITLHQPTLQALATVQQVATTR